MTNYFSHTLPCGLRIVHKPSISNVSYAGFIIEVGTRDESDDQFGMAHFIEHMLFKGTKKRTSRHIINRIESVGGELNAYTNKEETVLYSIFLENDFDRAFELMADMILNSDFPQAEIDKEVDVIIDEIHSYEDNPSELIFDEFENLLFSNTQLGHNILGSEESLKIFDTANAKQFFEQYYKAGNMVFFSMGNTNFEKIVKTAEKFFTGNKPGKTMTMRSIPLSQPIVPQRIRETKETSQVHAVLGSRSYDFHHQKRSVLYLLNNILGGPCMNSRLNLSLREKKGYVYNVESNMTSYSDTGIFSIYFGSDKRNLEKCLKLVNKELETIRNIKLTDTQLSAAKKQLLGQIGISSDNNENVVLALGKSYLHHNHFDSFEETAARINNVTQNDLLEVANEILSPDKIFSLIYC
ncbi:MAG: M16 family metallopeptidase [Dysgonomonas sp.]